MDIMEAIRERRTVRKFTEQEVSPEAVRELLEAARCAQSWANTQGWEFIVIRDKELIRSVTDQYGSTNPARACSEKASVVIVACARKDLAGFKNGEQRTKFDSWFMFDLGIAVQNLCLAAHSMGLGTVVVGSMNHDMIHELLFLPPEYEVVVSIPIGYPAQIPQPKGRKELFEIAHLDRFGRPLL